MQTHKKTAEANGEKTLALKYKINLLISSLVYFDNAI